MNSSTSARLVVTILGWALLMAVMVLLAQLLSPSFGALMKIFVILFTLLGVMILGFGWMWGRVSNLSEQKDAAEDLKRNRITMALRDLSDSELVRLRQRLASGDVDEEQLMRLMDESESSKAKRS
jgi:hypothetical protein